MHEFLGWEADVHDKQYHSPTDDDDRAVLPGTLASIWCIGSGRTPSNRVRIIAVVSVREQSSKSFCAVSERQVSSTDGLMSARPLWASVMQSSRDSCHFMRLSLLLVRTCLAFSCCANSSACDVCVQCDNSYAP